MTIHKPYQYKKTYIGLPVDALLFKDFPETVEWAGEMLLKKDNFHVTVCFGENIFSQANEQNGIPQNKAEEKLLTLFNSFVERTPITLSGFVHDFRYVKDPLRGRKSIVLKCQANNLEAFFETLNKQLKISIPLQPAHVTLYTLQQNLGIHIPSEKIMDSFPIVSLHALDKSFANINKK